MKRSQEHESRAWARWLLLACMSWGLVATAVAAPPARMGTAIGTGGPTQIQGAPTTMESSTETMISLRHQHHMWQTSDGAAHLLVNRGSQPGGNSLQLYSSFDNAATWTGSVMVPRSGDVTASDGFIDGDVLYLTHSTPSGEVIFTALQYDVVSGTWSRLWFESAFLSPDVFAINPAVAADANGTVWLAFTALDNVTGNYSIKMLRNSSPTEGWVDTGFVFGDVDNLAIERSARPVVTSYGMGLVYTVHDTIYWASRSNHSPLDKPWQGRALFTSTAADEDPYASLFSVVVDANDVVHVAFTDGGRLGYVQVNEKKVKRTAKWLSGDIFAGYVQTSIANGKLVIAVNVSDRIGLYQSSNGGKSFTYTHLLVHDQQPASGNYANPRLETPMAVTGTIPLVQQYQDTGVQRLLTFGVPAN